MSSLLSGVQKMEILMKATFYKVHKIMPRLDRTLFGLWMLVCLWACQTIGPEASQSENQATKFLQTTSSLKKTERTHINFQNTVDKVAFFDLPEVTNWSIVSLADFSLTRDVLTRSGQRHTYRLTNHNVEATKSKNSAVLVLSKIPSCEGAGGEIGTTEVYYTVLQGACSELVLQPDGTTQEVAGTYADMIMFNLISNLGAGHIWDLRGDRLILLDREGRQRAEFLRTASLN